MFGLVVCDVMEWIGMKWNGKVFHRLILIKEKEKKKHYNSHQVEDCVPKHACIISIPTNITSTGNQTLINLHVSGSVETTPRSLKIETMTTEMKFSTHKSLQHLHH